MHEHSEGTPNPSPCSKLLSFLLSTSELLWGGAIWPLTKSELGSVTGWARSSSSGPILVGLWFLLYSSAALLSTSRKWPRDWGLLTLLASVLSLKHKEKSHILDLVLFFSFEGSVFLPLNDLLENSKMLETPIRLPRVMLLSWKKDPVDCNAP